jgi:hypothetical protein
MSPKVKFECICSSADNDNAINFQRISLYSSTEEDLNLDVNNGSERSILNEYLSLNGAGSTFNMAYNFTSGSEQWIWICPANKKAIITRMIVHCLGNSVDPDEMMSESAITNGFKILYKTRQTSTIANYLGGTNQITIKKNADIDAMCHDLSLHKPVGIADEVANWRFTFAKSGIPGLCLYPTGEFIWQAQDIKNFTTNTTEFLIQIQGYTYPYY